MPISEKAAAKKKEKEKCLEAKLRTRGKTRKFLREAAYNTNPQ